MTENPFDFSQAPDGLPPRPERVRPGLSAIERHPTKAARRMNRRPQAIFVLAVLNLVIGVLWQIVSTWCLFVFWFIRESVVLFGGIVTLGHVNPEGIRSGAANVVAPLLIFVIVQASLVAPLLLAAGFGLLRLRPWGRWASILVAPAAGANFLVLVCLTSAWRNGNVRLNIAFFVIGVLLYPAVLLAFMLIPKVAAAFADAGQ